MLTYLKFEPGGPPNLDQYGAGLSKAVTELRSLRSALKEKQQTEASPDLSDRSLLPPPHVCKALVESYLRTFERLYCILDVPRFREQSDQFWEGTPSLPKVRPLFPVSILHRSCVYFIVIFLPSRISNITFRSLFLSINLHHSHDVCFVLEILQTC